MRRAQAAWCTAAALAVVSPPSIAAVVAPGAASGPPATSPNLLCREQIPEGQERPKLTETMAPRVLAGHVIYLQVDVAHDRGQIVMPGGARIQTGGSDSALLRDAGFVLPEPNGPARASIRDVSRDQSTTTRVRIPLVPLPDKPGRHTLTLPSLPITVARANGSVMTLCTSPHQVEVDDPTASAPNAKPKPNPPGMRQLEEWTSLKHSLFIGAAALVLGALLAWLWIWWRKRPKKARPAPPPRPPWEVALEELSSIRADDLVSQQRYSEHYDRVSDTIRKYLGARYAFDGLESTTREALVALRRSLPYSELLHGIEDFLLQADLVKFARLTPSEEQCSAALEEGAKIVQSTLPIQGPSNPDVSPGPRPSGET